MNITIIGSQGYIGSFLSEKLRNNGIKVFGYDIKPQTFLKHDDEIQKSYKNITTELENSDIIIFLAGVTGRKDADNMEETDIINENVKDVCNLAKKLNKNQLFIYASTAAMLEGSNIKPEDEHYECDTTKMDKYTYSMFLREQSIKNMIDNNEIVAKCIGLRFGTVIGISPCQRTDLVHISMLRSAFFKGIINVINPLTKRSILWNIDLFNVIHSICINKDKIEQLYNIFNVASYNCSIAKIANEISSKTGSLLNYVDPKSNSYTEGFLLDCSKIKTDFNIEFQGTFESIYNDLINNISKILIGNTIENYNLNMCRVCKKQDLMMIIDLGSQPLANNFFPHVSEQPTFPLELVRCKNCHHTQLNHTVPPENMFSNYLYESGTSTTLKNYFKMIANKCDIEKETDKIIIELACNDGSQLDEFKKLGWKTIGIDPAKNISEKAILKGHDIRVGFWGIDTFDNLPTPDIIMGQNVLAHVPDPLLFLQECYKYMNDNTELYIQTSQCNMYLTGEFDTVYHEHLSFFTAHSFKFLAESVGLNIVSLEKTPIHGTSFLVKMKKNNGIISHDITLLNILNEEVENGLTNDTFYIQFREKAKNMNEWFQKHVFNLNDKGYKLIAYGAAAKGMTLINYMKPSTIEFIVDDALAKQNTFSPGLNIPIFPTNKLINIQHDIAIIVFAWNFIDEIINNIKKLRNGNSFRTIVIVPYPVPKIISITQEGIKVIAENMIKQVDIKNTLINTCVLTHFYNEEFLIRQWIRHHSPLFQKGILIDYNSTDKTLDIIKEEAPSTWIVVKSRNKDFEAKLVDQEIMDYEGLPDNKDIWKIALTTTEFLVHVNLRNMLKNIEHNCIHFPSFKINGVDKDDISGLPFNDNISIIKQRYRYIDEGNIFSSYSRFIHKNIIVNYLPGRHVISENYAQDFTGFICKFIYSPWPEIKVRKLQIQARMPMYDKHNRLGIQHLVNEDQLYNLINENKNTKSLFLNDLNTPYNFIPLTWLNLYT